MGLAEYKKKRTFTKTTEPQGGKSAGSSLRFVVQKHDASRLHYDFRLEMDGVLKSWAVPKGPSMNPADKRLAMMVEDHPYDYKDFEGIIPEGNYGAGTVIVWDEGEYEPATPAGDGKKVLEKQLLKELKQHKLHFILHGKKLKGEFALVKTHNSAENAWLLMKIKDKYASDKDITTKDRSVVSRKTIAGMERTAARVWKNGKSVKRTAATPKKAAKKTARKTAAKRKTTSDDEKEDATTVVKDATIVEAAATTDAGVDVTRLLKKCPKAGFPKPFKPMLATRVEAPFDSGEWVYEIKWDGYRAVSYLNKSGVNIYSRNLLSFNERFPQVLGALKEWGVNAVLDGEIVAIGEDGQPNFQLLQNNKNQEDVQYAYYIFDIIWYEGKDVTALTLVERKAILASLLPAEDPVLRYSSDVAERGTEFFEAAVKLGLEGVMAKKADSNYSIGFRSREWLKIKNDRRMEAIICGFTKPRNSRSYFGAVILGKYEGDKLVYIGHSGSGFTEALLKEMHRLFQPLIRKTSPFTTVPKTNMPVTWLKPELVCEVKFTERTTDGLLRHPIFLGLREDKKAVNEKNEAVVKVPDAPKKKTVKQTTTRKPAAKKRAVKKTAVKKTAAKKTTVKKTSAKKPTKSTPVPDIDTDVKETTITVKGNELKLTNLNKLYWPKEKITKGDMLRYYAEIAPYIMPYLKDRPQSLNRHPDGITKPGFFHKNMPDTAPNWIDIFPYSSDSSDKLTNYLVCRSETDLMYMASLGCIEINPWHSRVPKVDKPDWCVIDLDPDTNTFKKVIETANVVKQVLDSIGADSYCKTSGSTGLHIYVPLGGKYSYDQSRMLAQVVVQMVQQELPRFTSIERSPAKRKGKIYLDYLQNKTTQTIAAPYSLRPKPGAPVSTPLHWEEVKAGLKILDHNIHNIFDRLKEQGDIFKPVLGKGIDLKKVLAKLESLQAE